jgi:type II secretory ATPase GspE/PulE/Tfp pilus assembly ATPase PilB-like protein
MAIHTALTGHLVFSTLHTNDAASAITRLIDMGVEPFLVASTVEGIVAQRLVRRVCQYCSELYHPDEEILLDLGLKQEEIANLPKDLVIRRHVGCKECRNIGYSGRTGIFEIIPMNENIREMCIKGITSNQIKREAIKTTGMKTLREDGWRKVKAGLTTIEEVMRLTTESDYEFEQIEAQN